MDTQMHLTCTNINEQLINETLDYAKRENITNILALRGDPPSDTKSWTATDENFQYGSDLVKYIKKKYNDTFGICVAGYPEGHPDSNYDDDLIYLKKKFDCGADFIITQLFYDVDIFLKFFNDCRKIGITCPILPGILPIVGYNNFKRMTSFCNISVPEHITQTLEKIKDDNKQVTQYGIKLAVDMCNKLIINGIKGIHFYTLNREDSITSILETLQHIQK
jgi:methylenetetrahydrofolate reductase (NADPH)